VPPSSAIARRPFAVITVIIAIVFAAIQVMRFMARSHCNEKATAKCAAAARFGARVEIWRAVLSALIRARMQNRRPSGKHHAREWNVAA
jgi:hypothetical protein